MTINRKLCLATLVFVSLILSTGCKPLGYTAESQFRTGIASVYVPMWTRGREVYRRDLEQRLTEALIKQIEMSTDYKCVKKENADTQLSGKIIRVNQRTLSMNPDTGFPRETAVSIIVSFTWEDLRTGKEIVSEKKFSATTVYHPTAPFNEEFFRGSERTFDKLAQRIVEKMKSEW